MGCGNVVVVLVGALLIVSGPLDQLSALEEVVTISRSGEGDT